MNMNGSSVTQTTVSGRIIHCCKLCFRWAFAFLLSTNNTAMGVKLLLVVLYFGIVQYRRDQEKRDRDEKRRKENEDRNK